VREETRGKRRVAEERRGGGGTSAGRGAAIVVRVLDAGRDVQHHWNTHLL
jgi:hypothetical protein